MSERAPSLSQAVTDIILLERTFRTDSASDRRAKGTLRGTAWSAVSMAATSAV